MLTIHISAKISYIIFNINIIRIFVLPPDSGYQHWPQKSCTGQSLTYQLIIYTHSYFLMACTPKNKFFKICLWRNGNISNKLVRIKWLASSHHKCVSKLSRQKCYEATYSEEWGLPLRVSLQRLKSEKKNQSCCH